MKTTPQTSCKPRSKYRDSNRLRKRSSKAARRACRPTWRPRAPRASHRSGCDRNCSRGAPKPLTLGSQDQQPHLRSGEEHGCPWTGTRLPRLCTAAGRCWRCPGLSGDDARTSQSFLALPWAPRLAWLNPGPVAERCHPLLSQMFAQKAALLGYQGLAHGTKQQEKQDRGNKHCYYRQSGSALPTKISAA